MSNVVDPRDTKQLFGGILYGSCPVILFFFPLSFLFPLTNFFPLTIFSIPPPKGMLEQKKVLHILEQILRKDPVDQARKSDRVPNMFKLANPGHNPPQSHPQP